MNQIGFPILVLRIIEFKLRSVAFDLVKANPIDLGVVAERIVFPDFLGCQLEAGKDLLRIVAVETVGHQVQYDLILRIAH